MAVTIGNNESWGYDDFLYLSKEHQEALSVKTEIDRTIMEWIENK